MKLPAKVLKDAKKTLEDQMIDILKRLMKIEIELYQLKKGKSEPKMSK